MTFQPAINDDKVFDFDREAWRFTSALFAVITLLLSHGHVFQSFKLAGAHFDGCRGLFDQRFNFRVAAFRQVAVHGEGFWKHKQVRAFAK